jgi:hypothetical protein
VLVELIFQLAHSFSLFSAGLVATFAWVIAGDFSDLVDSRMSRPVPSTSAILSVDNSNDSPRIETGTKIQIVETQMNSADSIMEKSGGDEPFE